MPFIPRQVKPPARQVITCKLPEETATLLKRYAQFLESTQEYVINETLSVAFRRDKEFQAWLASSPAGDAPTESQTVARSRQADRPRS
jgi:predicted transcriptional regulator